MSAGTIKIPEPIIAPTTNIVESNRFNPRANLRGFWCVVSEPDESASPVMCPISGGWWSRSRFDDCILYP